tara:strand:+ start:797 stop:2143 length:1347 start_codon:yes stop_codon:yes gene_type:complete
MADSNLAFIGAILSVSLGFFALHLVRKNENLKWNEAIAGHLISLIFICKGLQYAASGYFEEALNSGMEGDKIWQFWAQFLTIMDYAFGSGIIMIALLYPIPFLRSKKQLKIAVSIIATLFIFIPLILDVTGNPWTVLHLNGLLYVIAGFAWGSIYIYFKLINEKERNNSTKNISMVCGLFLTLQMGHIWMMWPGMFLQADYFYFIDLGSTGVGTVDITSTMFDYFWLVGYTFCIAVGLTMLAVEIYQAINGNSSVLLYILSFYFIIGAIGYAVLSSTGGSAFWNIGEDSDIKEMWKTFTSQMHFTVLRSLIALYILLKYSFFDINEKTKPIAKLMAIILIVVATSAVLELVQSIIPLNQMLTAALLGIIIAFGIGWEEKSFDRLVANPANINDSIDKKWFPSIKLPEGVLKKLDIACWIFIIIAALFSLIVWKTDGILNVVLERGGVS